MKPVIKSLLLSVLLAHSVTAAEPDSTHGDQKAVLQVLQQFFDALHDKDGDMLRAICQPGAQFSSGRPASEGYVVRSRPVEADIASFAESKDIWLERMWAPTVHIEGRIAVVWTRYDFHRSGKFSHNGTDCFTLLKTDAGWKIVCAAYSVEPGGKTENPAGPPH